MQKKSINWIDPLYLETLLTDEEKAIQKAVYASIELNAMKDKVETSINEKTKDIKPLIGLNLGHIKRRQTRTKPHIVVKGKINGS